MTVKRILGIDPGSRITGFGVISQQANISSHVSSGCIRLTEDDIPRRLAKLYFEVQELVQTYDPHEIAIEQVFVHKNAMSALKLGQARGVAIAAAMAKQLPIYEYAPRAIKQAIVGTGAAEKAQVQTMIKILLNLDQVPQADAADALAIALCHIHSGVNAQFAGANAPRRRKSSKRSNNWKNYDRTD